MKPLTRPNSIIVYQLLKLGQDGKFYPETSSVTEQGDMGAGFYSDQKIVQYQQTILALKNIPTHIFELEWIL